MPHYLPFKQNARRLTSPSAPSQAASNGRRRKGKTPPRNDVCVFRSEARPQQHLDTVARVRGAWKGEQINRRFLPKDRLRVSLCLASTTTGGQEERREERKRGNKNGNSIPQLIPKRLIIILLFIPPPPPLHHHAAQLLRLTSRPQL